MRIRNFWNHEIHENLKEGKRMLVPVLTSNAGTLTGSATSHDYAYSY
jgi:hypothetical protein